jgi:hypothetical protein
VIGVPRLYSASDRGRRKSVSRGEDVLETPGGGSDGDGFSKGGRKTVPKEVHRGDVVLLRRCVVEAAERLAGSARACGVALRHSHSI